MDNETPAEKHLKAKVNEALAEAQQPGREEKFDEAAERMKGYAEGTRDI